jgi:hypothetical protein
MQLFSLPSLKEESKTGFIESACFSFPEYIGQKRQRFFPELMLFSK